MFRRIFLAAASVIAVSSAANAADMYRAPEAVSLKDTPYVGVNWSGFYVGANGGYGWSEWDHQLSTAAFNGVSPKGGFGGGQFGYNAQRGNVVFGLETDIEGADIAAGGIQGANKYSSHLDWFGTLRGRVGYSFDRALVYATGGLTYGGVRNTAEAFTKNTDAVGWVAGAGLEYKINPSFSVKGEYQFIDLGKNCPMNGAACWGNVAGNVLREDAYHTVRVGLNYFIAPAYEPLK